MFLANVLNAKVHLFSGLIVGALVVAAAGQMKSSCRCHDKKCNSIQPSSGNNEEKLSA
tara:strand:+ start:63 stop:236 length:174 start_codon:yes stop_codon:yes gene_type:complete